MLAKILEFVKGLLAWLKANLDNVILIIIIMLFILLSFASGYIIAKYQDREPVLIQQK